MTRKIRLLHLIDQLGDAGAENLLYTFASGLDRTRFDLHICALRPWAPPKIVPALRALGVPVTELDQHHAYDIPILRALVRYIRHHRIDLIHTHLMAADIMGRMAGFLTRRPVVSTMHNGRRDLDREAPHRQWMERLSAHIWCRRIIVVSGRLRPEIRTWFRVPAGRVIAIPNGVHVERFQPAPGFDAGAVRRALLGGEGRMVTNVARLVPEKGQRYLVAAAAAIVRTHPDVRLVLVGDGPLRGEIEALAAEQGLGDRLVITGIRTDVPAILAASEVFVLPSLWEGMPVSLLEAMAAGCPAVASDVGGIGELVQTGVTGLLVPPADTAALAGAIANCLDEPERARQRARAARALVVQHFSMRAMTRRCEALYLHELGRRR